MRVPLRRHRYQLLDELLALVQLDSLTGNQTSECTYHFYVQEVRNGKGIISLNKIAADEGASSTATGAFSKINAILVIRVSSPRQSAL